MHKFISYKNDFCMKNKKQKTKNKKQKTKNKKLKQNLDVLKNTNIGVHRRWILLI